MFSYHFYFLKLPHINFWFCQAQIVLSACSLVFLDKAQVLLVIHLLLKQLFLSFNSFKIVLSFFLNDFLSNKVHQYLVHHFIFFHLIYPQIFLCLFLLKLLQNSSIFYLAHLQLYVLFLNYCLKQTDYLLFNLLDIYLRSLEFTYIKDLSPVIFINGYQFLGKYLFNLNYFLYQYCLLMIHSLFLHF